MKNKIVIFFLTFNLIFFSCIEDEIPLPQVVEIEVLNTDLVEGKIELRGTPLLQGQTGEWEILSNNQVAGVFSDKSSFITFLKGNIYEEYEIKWTISNNNSESNYNIIHRMSAGYSLAELLEADRDIKTLLSFYTLRQLISVQSSHKPSFNELIEAGVSLSELLNFTSIYTLYIGGVTIEQMIDEGLSIREIFEDIVNDYNSSVGREFIQEFIDLDITILDMFNEGIDLVELYSLGATLQEIINAGVSFKEIIVGLTDFKITTLTFLQMGFDEERLKQESLILEINGTGFYFMAFLHEPILLNADEVVQDINNNLPNMNTWRIPTIDELQYIYGNKNNFELGLDNQFLYPNNPVVEVSETAIDINEWLSSTQNGECFISHTSGGLIIEDEMKTLNLKTGSLEEVCLSIYMCDCVKFTYLIPVIQL
jgi:hypothetical protein